MTKIKSFNDYTNEEMRTWMRQCIEIILHKLSALEISYDYVYERFAAHKALKYESLTIATPRYVLADIIKDLNNVANELEATYVLNKIFTDDKYVDQLDEDLHEFVPDWFLFDNVVWLSTSDIDKNIKFEITGHVIGFRIREDGTYLRCVFSIPMTQDKNGKGKLEVRYVKKEELCNITAGHVRENRYKYFKEEYEKAMKNRQIADIFNDADEKIESLDIEDEEARRKVEEQIILQRDKDILEITKEK